MSISIVFALALVASQAVITAAGLQSDGSTGSTDDGGFELMRQPVLGFAIERNDNVDLYRLVSASDRPKVLHIGSLEECEEALVAKLRERHGEGRVNFRLPTLGGVQFWGDVFWYAGWRIQENVYTGHFRLLDPDDRRAAWGTWEACRTEFENVRSRRKLRLDSDHLVVLLHGLGRSRTAMEAMRTSLEDAGFAVAAVGYPSTRQSISEHAEGLGQLLDNLDDVRHVSFITHSLGGIVVRAALADEELPWRKRMKLGRVVMLAPPSRGSELARELAHFSPFQTLAGPSALELTTELKSIPAPPCPFGIVAASRENDSGLNPFIDGDDDGIVSVEETKLEGAADHLTVKGIHTLIMNDRDVIAATVRFLHTSRFRE